MVAISLLLGGIILLFIDMAFINLQLNVNISCFCNGMAVQDIGVSEVFYGM